MEGSGLVALWPYIRRHLRWFAVSALFAVVGASASAFSPFLLGHAVDALRHDVNARTILLYSLGIVGLACTLAIFRYLLRMLTGRIAATISYELSQDYFAQLLAFDGRNYAFFGKGDLLSRGTVDFIFIWQSFSGALQMTMHSLVLLVIGCALMASSSLLLAAIVFGSLASIMAAQVFAGPMIKRAFYRAQQDLGDMSGFAQEHLGAARMFKAYSQEPQVLAAYSRVDDRYASSNLRFMLLNGLISPVPGTVVQVSAAVVLAIGGTLVIHGGLSVGQLVQFIVYLGLLSTAAMQLSSSYMIFQQGATAANRITEVIRHRPRIRDERGAVSPDIRGSISLRGVGVKAGDRWILRDINLDIEAGRTVGIVGATGSGKSTLLSLITRVQEPDEGKILLDGRDIRSIKLDTLHDSMAIVPQETFLFSMSLRDNITLGMTNVPDERVEEALLASRLSNDLPQLPHGLATEVGEGGASLSGGQRQRTSIARALIRDPKILLLDDALASVDAETAVQITRALAERGADRSRTTLIVTQNLMTVRNVDEIVILDEGRIVEQGAHDELLRLGGYYARMHARQAGSVGKGAHAA